MAHPKPTTVLILAPYQLSLSRAEREAVLVALELAIAVRRGEPEAPLLVADVAPALLDRVADRLFLLGAPAAPA